MKKKIDELAKETARRVIHAQINDLQWGRKRI